MTDLKLETILNESSLVSKTDARGRITFANKKFCEVSKYSEEELIGKDHKLLNSGNHNKDFWKNMYEVTVEGRRVWEGTVKNKAKDGSFYWVKTFVQCVFNGEKVQEFISVRQDVTKEVLQAEEISGEKHKLIKLTQELSEKNAVLEAESQGIRDYNLSMEELKAKNKLKLSSLIIVMVPIFIIIVVLIFRPVKEAVLTLVSGLFGMMIGGFLTDLLTQKEKN